MISSDLLDAWVTQVRTAYDIAGPDQARLELDGIGGAWGTMAVGAVLDRLDPAAARAISAGGAR